MKVYRREISDRYVSFRGLPVWDVLRTNRVPAMYLAHRGFCVRRERVPDVEAMFEDAVHRIVELP